MEPLVPSIRVNVPLIWIPVYCTWLPFSVKAEGEQCGTLTTRQFRLYVTHHEIPDIRAEISWGGGVCSVCCALHTKLVITLLVLLIEAKVIVSLLSLQLCRKLWYILVCYSTALVREWGNISELITVV